MKNNFRKLWLSLMTLALIIQPVNYACAQQRREKNNNRRSNSSLNQVFKTIPVEIPITNQIYIEARLNNSAPMWFLLDTGATFTILDTDKAKEMGIKTGDDRTLDLGQTNTVNTSFARNAMLGISGVDVPVETLWVMPVKFRHAPQIVGIIGSEVFRKFVVEIDYQSKMVNLYEPESFQYKGKGEVLPIAIYEEIPHVKCDFTKDGKQFSANLMIDTGAAQAIFLYAPFVEKNKLLDSTEGMLKVQAGGLGGGGINVKGRVKTFNIGKIVFDNPIVSFSQNRNATRDFRDGNIGNGLLDRFKIILDYSRRQAVFEPTDRLNLAFDFNFFLLDLMPTESGFRVNDIYQNSTASEAGLKTNDVILAVDGKSLSNLSLVEVSRMFLLDGRERELQIKRGTETMRLKLKNYKVDFLPK